MSARHRKRKRDYTTKDWRRLIERSQTQFVTETDQKKRNVLDRRINQAIRALRYLSVASGQVRARRPGASSSSPPVAGHSAVLRVTA